MKTYLFIASLLLPLVSFGQRTIIPSVVRPQRAGEVNERRDPITGIRYEISKLGPEQPVPVDTIQIRNWGKVKRLFKPGTYKPTIDSVTGLNQQLGTITQSLYQNDTAIANRAKLSDLNRIISSGSPDSTAYKKSETNLLLSQKASLTDIAVKPTVASLSAVRSYTGSTTTAFSVNGRIYALDLTSTSPDNGGEVIVAANGQRFVTPVDQGVTINQFGAIAGDNIDDTQAILNAINSGASLVTALVPKDTTKAYLIAGPLVFSNLNGKRLELGAARFLNTTNTRSFLFQDCKDLQINGGKFGLATMPTTNGGLDQHVFQFTRCQNITLTGGEILNSSEMGIAFTYCNNTLVENYKIHNTFRDGVYHRYSANAKVVRSTFRDNKDDAISFHSWDQPNDDADPGKAVLQTYGYQQATNFLAEGNDIARSYQGIVTIAGDSVSIINNKIGVTVLSGIGAYNLLNTKPETVKNLIIRGNTLTGTNAGTKINGVFIENNGQSGPGRSAIFISSLGNNNQIGQGESKHISNVILENNTVENSGAHGLLIRLVDGIKNLNTTLKNCSGPIPAKSLPGIPFELGSYTDYSEDGLSILDTRTTKRHQYAFNSTDGVLTLGRRRIEGVAVAENLLNATTYKLNNTRDGVVRGQSPISNSNYITAAQLNDDRPSNFYTVEGVVPGLPTDPTGFNAYFMVMNRLENNTVNPPFYATQELTRFDNVKFFRTRNEAAGGWSAWKQVSTITP